MVLLALGFDGVETAPLLTDLDVGTDPLGRIECDVGWQTRTPGVFVCGDAHRGASLVVWAIAEGRSGRTCRRHVSHRRVGASGSGSSKGISAVRELTN